ncbi:riboflavin synthase [Anderseniella sp. Alg231-50]|uniref:riboflavin synthase n=1 Tax=Anderseniella sp. Alg231-50 TaxID=1922226 RepID=UPI000D55B8D7
MFTGIITDIGTIEGIERRGDTQFTISSGYDAAGIALGASICCSGCCLTVTSVAHGADGGCHFTVDVSAESLSKTTLGGWAEGTRINLERALKAGDELGGHIVSGHVDGVADIVSIEDDGDSRRFVFCAPEQLARFIASKGSVCLDGTSLTVNDVNGVNFGINVIPHTLSVTSWGNAQVGDKVNLEIDMLARYVARLNESLDK